MGVTTSQLAQSLIGLATSPSPKQAQPAGSGSLAASVEQELDSPMLDSPSGLATSPSPKQAQPAVSGSFAASVEQELDSPIKGKP